MGIMQYVLPLGIFAISIKLACEGKETITSKLVQYGIFLISLSIVFSIIQILPESCNLIKSYQKL